MYTISRKEFRVETNYEHHDIPLGGHIPGKMGTLSIYDDSKLLHTIRYVITDIPNEPFLKQLASGRVNSGCETAYFTATDRMIVRSFGPYLNENSNVIQFDFPVTDESYTFRFSELPVTARAAPPKKILATTADTTPQKKEDSAEKRLDYELDAIPKFRELIRTGEFAEALKVYDTIHERKNSLVDEAVNMFIALNMIDKACEVADERINAGYPHIAFKLEQYFFDANDKPKALQWCKKYFAMKEKQHDLNGLLNPSTYLQKYGDIKVSDRKDAFASLMKLEI